MPLDRKSIIISGDNFSDLNGFYDEIDRVLTRNLDWKTGHNLDALNDLLRGGFGVYEFNEPIKLIWENSNKSKNDLSAIRNGQSVFEIIVDIIRSHDHVDLVLA